MNKKGFTLIEVVITISILLLIISIAVPAITTLNKNQKQKQQARIYRIIENAAEVYVNNNSDTITDDLLPYSLDLNALISTGLLEDNIIDPVTNQKLPRDSFVGVEKIDNVYKYTYPYTYVVPPDITPPVITLTKHSDSIRQGTAVDLNSYVVSVTNEAKDKSTPTLTIYPQTINTNIVGTYDILYTATDGVSNSSTETLTITVYPIYIADGITLPTGCTKTSGTYSGTCYFTGANPNNYIWYSGYLWRMLKIESNGNIKIVTQDPIGAIAWGSSAQSYETSNLRTWLNGTFYNSLRSPTTYIDSKTWDINSSATVSTQSSFSDYVGTLTRKDYINTVATAFNHSSYAVNTTWLNSNSMYFTMSLYTYDTGCSTNYPVYFIVSHQNHLRLGNTGDSCWGMGGGSWSVDTGASYYRHWSGTFNANAGVRPVINLKSNLSLSSGGDGSSANPYRLSNDSSASTNALLNSRFIGEYVTFSGKTWRIMGKNTISGSSTTRILLNDVMRNSSNQVVARGFGDAFDPVNTNSVAYYLNNTYYSSLSDNSWILSSPWGAKNAFVGLHEREGILSGLDISLPYVSGADHRMLAYRTSNGGSTTVLIGGSSYKNPDDYRTGTIDQTYNYPNYYDYFMYRPAVNLGSTVKITGGSGTLTSPYTLAKP